MVGVGDWIQAVVEITEDNFAGSARHIHARAGGIGHVLEVLDAEGLVNAYWEHARTVTICGAAEYKVLGGPDTGRFQAG